MSIFDIFKKKQSTMATTVSSVFNRTGAVKAQSGDYNTSQITENSNNLYYTDVRSRAALSASGNINYNKSTGVFSYSTPQSLPPSGLAGGDLSGSYPNPLVKWSNGYGIYDKRYQLSGSLVDFPTTLPPSGLAGGDLYNSYPNPLVKWSNGFITYDQRYLFSGSINIPTTLPPSGLAGGDLYNSYPNPLVKWSNGYGIYDQRYQPSGSLTNWIDGYQIYDKRYQLSGSTSITVVTSSVTWSEGFSTYDTRYQPIGNINPVTGASYDVLTMFISNCNSQVSLKTTDYLSVNGGTSGNTILSKAIVVPSSGYLKNMFILASNSQPLDGNLVITLMKGSLISSVANTTLSVSINAGINAGTGTVYSNTSASIAVKAGDIIVISRSNNSASPSLTINSISLLITNN